MTPPPARPEQVAGLVDRAHREHWPAILTAAVRITRDLDVAEDCAQDAFLRALRSWPDGVPDRPAAWLTTVVQRIALDRQRREAVLRRKLPLLVEPDDGSGNPDDAPTDLLRLVFTCWHPALAREAQVALTLRLMCGLSTAEVAQGLLISESTTAARITRAKKKIAGAGIPFRIPPDAELPARLDAVLTVVHLVHTAGHVAAGPELTRPDLTARAVDLAQLLIRVLPREPEPQALLGLLLLTRARIGTRQGADGELVLLADQDRARWDPALTHEGLARTTAALRAASAPGRFTLQAAIAGQHAVAPSWERTDWPEVVRLYDLLLDRWPSPVVALNRSAAQGFAAGADLTAVLADLDRLAADPALRLYPYLPATRADVLRRLGRTAEAVAAYDAALALTRNAAERRHLKGRRDALRG